MRISLKFQYVVQGDLAARRDAPLALKINNLTCPTVPYRPFEFFGEKSVSPNPVSVSPAPVAGCTTCRHARAVFVPDLDRWGAALDSRVPALVRECGAMTGPAGVQLVNTFWRCGMWEGRG